jgi:hypothetical protein
LYGVEIRRQKTLASTPTLLASTLTIDRFTAHFDTHVHTDGNRTRASTHTLMDNHFYLVWLVWWDNAGLLGSDEQTIVRTMNGSARVVARVSTPCANLDSVAEHRTDLAAMGREAERRS